MMSTLQIKYETDLALVSNIFEYNQNRKAFALKVEQFDVDALRAYIVLVSHLQEQKSDLEPFLLDLISPQPFFQMLNESQHLLQTSKHLSNYLVDAFEVMTTVTKCIADNDFYEMCHAYLQNAIRMEEIDVISVYLQILHRMDRVFTMHAPIEIYKTIIDAVHGPISNMKLLNEALLLIETNIQKRRNSDSDFENEQLLNFMWQNLCSSRVAKHQCNICHSITSQLIQIYMEECGQNEKFRNGFLSAELWHFIRAAIESKEMVRRKQAIYVLQNILETNEASVMSAGNHNIEVEDVDLNSTWKSYFAVLESLLEIQCHLIISCLNQYLDAIVKSLPPFWYSIIFSLVLKHHNNVVIHFGIEFILTHGIVLEHDTHLMNGFYQAMNNTYLHSEAKIQEESLAKYFHKSNMTKTLDIMMLILWQPVPLWTVVKSLELYVRQNENNDFHTDSLLEFLKRSVRVIKHMPEVHDTVNILQIIGINKLSLEQLLALYDVFKLKEILDGYQQPFDQRKFEMHFIQLEKISIETKIDYFQHVIPDVKDQLRFLDEFYEKNRIIVPYFRHYEFLLMNSLCTEKTLKQAMYVIKPRIYNLMKPHGNITLEELDFAVTLLKFIVTKFTDDYTDSSAFKSINAIIVNFHDIVQKKLYTDHDPVMVDHIREQFSAINMKMTKCQQIYPNKLAVLGALADAIMLEDLTIDLSRFNPDDENDVRAIQGLYDCFIDKSHEFKLSHQANVVSTILKQFNQLELDIWKAYRILLSGKLDVDCIFKLTQVECVQQMDEILSDALIYGKELKGEEKQTYDFVISKSSSVSYNQKVRLTAMRAIASKWNVNQIRNIKNLLFEKNTEIFRVRYYTNSYHHMLKLRITQALAFLYRLDSVWDDRMLKIILEEANQTNVTHINELIIAATIDPSQMLQIISDIDGNKGMQSMFMTIYYVCCKNCDNIEFVKQCIEFLVKYIFVKQIIVRTSAQIVMIKMCEKFNLIEEFKIIYDSTKVAHEVKLSRALKFAYAYKYRFDQIDVHLMLHSMYTLREIPRITKMFTDEFYKYEIFDETDSCLVIHMDEDDGLTAQESVEVELGFIENADDSLVNPYIGGGGNVQRKLVVYRETFIDREVLNSLSDEFMRRDTKCENDLIILCSLLTKPANLGGLSRSGEVFGVKAIALDNLKHVKHNDFTSISMASEKWLKFFEVKHYNVVSYLMAMKSNGYTIVGAEQTAFGEELHKTMLPKKMVLVLGHEKDGIPANILNILDMAVEIPQFGVVRSLNVHVSATLFMWEYCKQHLIVNSNNSLSIKE